MKKVLLFSGLFALIFLFISCGVIPVDIGIQIDLSDPIALKDGSVVAPNSVVKLAWNAADGKKVEANVEVFLNNVKVKEFLNVTEAVFTVTEEGNYVAQIAAVGARANSARIAFSVNRLWEELYFSSNGLVQPDDIATIISQWVIDGKTPAIAYYRLGQNTVGDTDEVENARERIVLVDDNEDGVYDRWEVVSAFAQQWVDLPIINTAYGTAVPNRIAYEEKEIRILNGLLIDGVYAGYTVNFNPNGILFASVGLDLNRPYTRGILSKENQAGGDWSYGKILKLRERYDSDTKPEFKFELPEEIDVRDGSSFVVDINAENVASFGNIYNTRYMQLAIEFSKNLAVDSVEFGNFMANLKDVCSYKVFEEEDNNVLMIYRGFLDGTDEAEAVSDIFASITFEIVEVEEGYVAFPYNHYNEVYGIEYIPLFKDTENKNVDGFVLDYENFIEVNVEP